MAISVRLSVCPSVHPSEFSGLFATCFQIYFSNLVYTFSRWHDMSSLSFIIIGSLWPSLQPKVDQTHFLQSWTHKSREICQIWYVGCPLYTPRHKFRFIQKCYFQNFGDYFCAFWIFSVFRAFFWTCFQILISNLLYTSLMRHHRLSSSFIAIRTFWPTLQP